MVMSGRAKKKTSGTKGFSLHGKKGGEGRWVVDKNFLVVNGFLCCVLLPLLLSSFSQGGIVGLLSLANIMGRLLWSTLSDKVGRTAIYTIFFSLGVALCQVMGHE